MPTEVKRIKVEVKGEGSKELRRLARGLDGISKSTKRTASALERFEKVYRGLFFGSVFGVGIGNIIKSADSFQLLRDRIRVFEGNTADETFTQLAEAAAFTRTSVEGLAEGYNRVALATKELGLNSQQVIDFTTALQQTFRLSGATIAEATASTIQFTQGLASGQLRGQELRSVLEANAVAGQILADTFNTTRGNLIKLAESGAFTSEKVIPAFLNRLGDLNKQASLLGQTFGQTVTIALDRLRLKIDELNRFLGLNTIFQKGVELLVDNMNLLAIALGAVATTKVIAFFSTLGPAILSTGTALQFLVLQAGGIGAAASAVLAFNPATAAILAFGTALTVVAGDASEFTSFVSGVFTSLAKSIIDGLEFASSGIAKFARNLRLDTIASGFEASSEFLIDQSQLLDKELTKLAIGTDQNLKKLSENKFFKEKLKINAPNKQLFDFRKAVAALNLEFGKDGNIQKYQERLRKLQIKNLDEQLRTGRLNLIQYRKELEKLTAGNALERLNRQFEKGTIDAIEYSNALRGLRVEELKRGVQEGTASILELNKAISDSQETVNSTTFRTGVAQYIQSVGTLSQNIAGAVSNTFSRLEDSLVEFTKTGKFVFKDFAQAILDDLNRIIIRQLIVRQLANAALSFIPTGGGGGGGGGQGLGAIAGKGKAFGSGGIMPFASGGVVNSPTLFGYAGGKTGLMGEAGPEAILPLTRSSNGDLGVKATPSNVTVNVVNNAENTESVQREREDAFGNKVIDILIQTKVKEGISNGTFDKSLKQSYGLNRRGL